MVGQWWLVFGDPEAERGEDTAKTFIIDANTLEGAIVIALVLGANPAGMVQAMSLPAGSVAQEWAHRELTPDEARAVPCPPWAQTN